MPPSSRLTSRSCATPACGIRRRRWSRPRCAGWFTRRSPSPAPTAIPSQAMAKVSFRLVGAQDPNKIRAAFHAFVRARLPADAKVAFKSFAGAPATELAYDNPALAKTRAALAAEWGKKALAIGEG